MQTEADAQLIGRARAGDRRALDTIYRRYQPLAATTARRMLGEVADADDAVQETFVIVFERITQLADPAALCGWIMQIAARCAHRVFRVRRLARRVWHADPHAVLDRRASGAAGPDLLAELALLDRALDMPAELRSPWVLRHVDGLALDGIAARCACSVATVKRRLGHAQTIIDRHLDHRGAGVERPASAPHPVGVRPLQGSPEAGVGAMRGSRRPVSARSRTRDQFRDR